MGKNYTAPPPPLKQQRIEGLMINSHFEGKHQIFFLLIILAVKLLHNDVAKDFIKINTLYLKGFKTTGPKVKQNYIK